MLCVSELTAVRQKTVTLEKDYIKAQKVEIKRLQALTRTGNSVFVTKSTFGAWPHISDTEKNSVSQSLP